jgi:hypothetical protein
LILAALLFGAQSYLLFVVKRKTWSIDFELF